MRTSGFDVVRLIVLLGVLFSSLAAAAFRSPPVVWMAALLWSVLLISAVAALWARWRGGHWQVRCEAPPVATVGDEIVVRLEIWNRSRWPLLFFEVVARDKTPVSASQMVAPRIEMPRMVVPWLRPGQSARQDTTIHLARRGVHRLPPLTGGPTDPLGLFPPSHTVTQAAFITVWPRPLPLSRLNLGGGEGERSSASWLAVAGDSGDFRGVRAWRAGENTRRIHWKSTLRSGQTHIVEWEDEPAGDVAILLDNSAALTSSTDDEWALETAVQIAASAAIHALDHGRGVQLWCWQIEDADQAHERSKGVEVSRRVRPFSVEGRGPTTRVAVLDALAAVEIVADVAADAGQLMHAAAPSLQSHGTLLVTSARAAITGLPSGNTVRVLAIESDANESDFNVPATRVRRSDSLERILEGF